MVNWIAAAADPSMRTSPVFSFLVMVSSLCCVLVSASASATLPLASRQCTHDSQKRACDPYEHKTVLFDWKALHCLGGALWYSIFGALHGSSGRSRPVRDSGPVTIKSPFQRVPHVSRCSKRGIPRLVPQDSSPVRSNAANAAGLLPSQLEAQSPWSGRVRPPASSLFR